MVAPTRDEEIKIEELAYTPHEIVTLPNYTEALKAVNSMSESIDAVARRSSRNIISKLQGRSVTGSFKESVRGPESRGKSLAASKPVFETNQAFFPQLIKPLQVQIEEQSQRSQAPPESENTKKSLLSVNEEDFFHNVKKKGGHQKRESSTLDEAEVFQLQAAMMEKVVVTSPGRRTTDHVIDIPRSPTRNVALNLNRTQQ